MIQPVEFKVLVKPLPVEEISAGGIVLNVSKREQMAQVQAELIAIGGNAFEDWGDPKPVLGDVIYMAKYAGYVVGDNDDLRIINDKDICAVVR